MGFERRSFVLSKEPGVLPGSEFFITTDDYEHLDLFQYLIMCGHYHCVEGYRIDRLYYDYLFVGYIASGQLYVRYGGKERIAKQGDVVIMDLRQPHCYAAVGSLEFSWIHVRGEVSEKLYDMAYGQTGVILQGERCETIKERIHYILASFKTEQFLSAHALSIAIYEIMMNLLPASGPAGPASPNQIAAVAVEYMKYNLSNPIELSDIADATHLSKYHFSRIFKAHTGYTPFAYLQKLRLDTARHLLSTTEKTVKEIAYSVGYQSEMGFIIAFTEKVGISPGRFRQFPF